MKTFGLRTYLEYSLNAAFRQTQPLLVVRETLALLTEQLEREIAAAKEEGSDTAVSILRSSLADMTRSAQLLRPLT